MISDRDTKNQEIAKLKAERDYVSSRYYSTGNFAKKCALGKQLDAIDAQIKELSNPSNIDISPLARQISLLENKKNSLITRHAVSGNFGTRNGIWEEKEGVELQMAGLKAQSSATTKDELKAALSTQLTGLEKQHKGLIAQAQCTGNFYEKNSLSQLSTLAATQIEELKNHINLAPLSGPKSSKNL